MGEEGRQASNRVKRARSLPLAHGAPHRCFGCGEQNRTGLRLVFSIGPDASPTCVTRLARRFEGPHNCAHGGVIAALLDETMSKANRHAGIVSMTRQMEVEYLKPVPIGRPITLVGHHLRSEGRKHFCAAEIIREDGVTLARARGLFIAIDPALARRLADAT